METTTASLGDNLLIQIKILKGLLKHIPIQINVQYGSTSVKIINITNIEYTL